MASSSPKPHFKPSSQMLHAIDALQTLVQDDHAWAHDLSTRLHNLYTTLRKLQRLQSSSSCFRSIIPNRTPADFVAFDHWLQTHHGIRLSERGLKLGFVSEDADNATLFATKSVSANDLLLAIPSSMMLTSHFPSTRPSLIALSAAVPAIAASPSLALVLALLAEASHPHSPHSPYIAVLPAKHPIPFATFSARHVLALHPSAAQIAAVKALRAQVLDYTYVFKAVIRAKPKDLSLSCLSFDNWRWAVSVVMTRQNAIPVPPNWRNGPAASATNVAGRHRAPSSAAVMALVPLWDMFNHEAGELSTAVVLRGMDVAVECRAMRDFALGEAVTMCYGNRSNLQLALYSGFVQPGDNAHDQVGVSVKLGRDALLAPLKARVLRKRGVDVRDEEEGVEGGGGWVCEVGVGLGKDGVKEAMVVGSVVCMDKEALTKFLKEDGNGEKDGETRGFAQGCAGRTLVREAIRTKLGQYDQARRERGEESRRLEKEDGAAEGLIRALHAAEARVLTEALENLDEIKKTE